MSLKEEQGKITEVHLGEFRGLVVTLQLMVKLYEVRVQWHGQM